MALSDANITELIQILKVPRLVLETHLDTFPLNTNDQTAIESLITDYATYSDDFVQVEPTQTNFGTRTNPGANRNEIAGKILVLLQLDPEWISGGSRRLSRA